MDVDDKQRLRTNGDYNYYIVSAYRPNAQLFAVRAEWEIEDPAAKNRDESENNENEKKKIDDNDDDENRRDDGYHIASIQFANLPHLVIGLPRNTHDQVLALAEELELRVLRGHPMNGEKDHFPLEAAADSIFTLENAPNTVHKQDLQTLRQKEAESILRYLADRADEEEGEDGFTETEGLEVTLLG